MKDIQLGIQDAIADRTCSSASLFDRSKASRGYFIYTSSIALPCSPRWTRLKKIKDQTVDDWASSCRSREDEHMLSRFGSCCMNEPV